VPHELDDTLRKKSVDGAKNILLSLRELGPRQLDRVVTGDQSWVFVRNQPDGCWVPEEAPRPKKAKAAQGDEKVMLTVLFSSCRVWLINFLPTGQTFTADYMVNSILRGFEAEVRKTMPKNGTRGWRIHLDNCTPHRAALTQGSIANLGMIPLPHPPYSPDIAPSDFALFGWLKWKLRQSQPTNKSELCQLITKFLLEIDESWFASVWDEWITRLEWVSSNNGEYFTK